jgi:hypothetical protein
MNELHNFPDFLVGLSLLILKALPLKTMHELV